MALDTSITRTGPTRFPGGLTNVPALSPLRDLEMLSPLHQVVLGVDQYTHPFLPLGAPATNSEWTVTSVRVGVGANQNLAPVGSWPPQYGLTTDNAASDQEVVQDRRLIKKNFLNLRKVVVGGVFQITTTVANSQGAFGLFSGTSVAALGTDQFCFNWSGATLNFVNRNNSGTVLTTAVSTALAINTLYGAVAVLDPLKSKVAIYFGTVDGLDMTLSTRVPYVLPVNNSGVAVTTSNIPDGTNSLQCGFGVLTSAAAPATAQFNSAFAVLM